jgi:S-adenosylmethionine/arginine decarboxylase-like enzyme
VSLVISDEEYQAVVDAVEETLFGAELQLNLGGCDPDLIRDPDSVRRWLIEVVDHIGMKRRGEPQVVQFGEGVLYGTTGFQLITTSNVVFHGVDAGRGAFINIFSCAPFDVSAAVEFCVDFFKARAWEPTISQRRIPAVPKVVGG